MPVLDRCATDPARTKRGSAQVAGLELPLLLVVGSGDGDDQAVVSDLHRSEEGIAVERFCYELNGLECCLWAAELMEFESE